MPKPMIDSHGKIGLISAEPGLSSVVSSLGGRVSGVGIVEVGSRSPRGSPVSPVVVVSVVVAESGRSVVVVSSSSSPRVVDVVEPVVVVPGRVVVVVVDGRVVVVGRMVVVVLGGLVVVVLGGLVVVVVVGIWARASPGQAKIEMPASTAHNPRPAHLRSERMFDTVAVMRANTEVRGWGPSNTR
ncbi:MAG: hypothetical protein KY395_02970 [Actinobacteria bacterium]|nr:hypothetical protein [Actinomycetota bacterium]